MNKIPVYFIPGMCCSTDIFEHIILDDTLFEMHLISWPEVTKSLSLQQYAQIISLKITHANPILVGVSFGGIVAQEISKLISVEKTIIISSIRCTQEYPPLYKFSRRTKLHKLLPTGKFNWMISFLKLFLNDKKKDRLNYYDKYLPLRDKNYLDWTINTILNWKQNTPIKNVYHLHGELDELFPIKYIKNATIISGGTHAMIIVKHKQINKLLQQIILE